MLQISEISGEALYLIKYLQVRKSYIFPTYNEMFMHVRVESLPFS